MIFTSIQYLALLGGVLAAIAVLPVGTPRKLLLLAASYGFYAYWDYHLVPLLLVLSLANWFVALRVQGARADGRLSARWLASGIAFDLAILGAFKYAGFFVANWNALFQSTALRIPSPEIVLPVGISFMTFEVISYIVDVRKGDTACSSPLDVCLLVAFFPHLISGPILKPRHFLPQLERGIVVRRSGVVSGGQVFLLGAIKKMLVADRLAPFVDSVFAHPAQFSSITIWLAVIAYAIQIYCDFSGYSDMAIGSARCMGIEIPRNFASPYASRNIAEFWRRWHISLSTWFRQYLYFSLGGNRLGRRRQYANLMAVMFLCGLWHGASWHFVVWGVVHGMALVVHRMYSDLVKHVSLGPQKLVAAASWAATTLFVLAAWVLFRAKDFGTAWYVLRKMAFATQGGMLWAYTGLLLILPIACAAHAVGCRMDAYPRVSLRTFGGLFVVFFLLLALLYASPTTSSPFIYFQF